MTDVGAESQVTRSEKAATPEAARPYQFDAVIAFGQGPVLDTETKLPVEKAKAQGREVTEEINSWGKTTAIAVSYLRQRGLFREAFYSGGRTGGATVSEAQLTQSIAGEITPADSDRYEHIEDKSPNTLANLENTLNLMDSLMANDSTGERKFDSLALVCSDFHAARIRMLAALYNLPHVTIFSSEQVLKVMAADPNVDDAQLQKVAGILIPDRDTAKPVRELLTDWVDKRLDSNNNWLNRTGEGDNRSYVGGGKRINERAQGFGYFANQPGEEGKQEMERRRNEDMFSEGLLTIPENWLGFIADINSDDRFAGILANIATQNPEFLPQVGVKGVDFLQPEGLDAVRDTLRPYKQAPDRKFVSLDWKPWSQEASNAAAQLLTSSAGNVTSS